MSQSPERCRNNNNNNENVVGHPPPPTPSFRRIVTGMLCFCVPVLLITSWQSTHRWSLSNIMMTEEATSWSSIRNSTTTGSLRKRKWQPSQQSTTLETTKLFHFCGQPRVTAAASNNNNDESLTLMYQCAGPQYEQFAASLRTLAYNQSLQSDERNPNEPRLQEQCTAATSQSSPTHEQWGRRDYPLPDNTTVLVLGNSHLRQISKTLACQYAHSLTSIHFLPTLVTTESSSKSRDDNSTDNADNRQSTSNSDGFVLEFENNARWISITNTVLAYSPHWKQLIEDFFLSSIAASFNEMDAVVLGKFTSYEEAKDTNFERMMGAEQEAYYQAMRQRRRRAFESDANSTQANLPVDFASVAPPELTDVARIYNGPLLSVSMFSKSDAPRFWRSYERYQDECKVSVENGGDSQAAAMNQANVYLVDGRRYIHQLNMECGTDDKNVLGTCNEPASFQQKRTLQTNATKLSRDPSDMHRCAGEGGGHADLIAWDVVEGLFEMISREDGYR